MLPGKKSALDKLLVRVCQDNDELNGVVGKEGLGGPVVLSFREIDGAMPPSRFLVTVLRRRSSSLQEGVQLEIGVGEDEGEVEALGRKAVTDDADLDGLRHGECFGVGINSHDGGSELSPRETFHAPHSTLPCYRYPTSSPSPSSSASVAVLTNRVGSLEPQFRLKCLCHWGNVGVATATCCMRKRGPGNKY
jgi:hypothetical protein